MKSYSKELKLEIMNNYKTFKIGKEKYYLVKSDNLDITKFEKMFDSNNIILFQGIDKKTDLPRTISKDKSKDIKIEDYFSTDELIKWSILSLE
jgi:hypothetical protein